MKLRILLAALVAFAVTAPAFDHSANACVHFPRAKAFRCGQP